MLSGEPLDALERSELEKFDADSLIREKEDVSRERDQLKSEQHSFKRGQQLHNIARRFNCSDPDYLDFLATRQDLDLTDDNAVTAFVVAMQKNSPHCFYSSVRSGGGAAGNTSGSKSPEIPEHDRIGRIAASLALAPEQH
jgi:hypothetical protein